MMRASLITTLIATLVATLLAAAPALAQPLSTAFTYQGSLADAGNPANGTFDLRFRLYDQAASPGGTQIGPTLCVDDITIVDGRISTQLDFGAVFAGQRRFLEVAVRPGSAGNCFVLVGYTQLLPRQEVTAAPNAAFSLTAANASSLNGQAPSFYTNAANISAGTLSDQRLSINIATNNGVQTFSGVKTFSAAPSFTASGAPFAVSGSGLVNNLNADLLDGLSSAAFAPASHTHDAAALISGTLADARIASNIPRLANVNAFTAVNSFSAFVGLGTTTPTARLNIRDTTNLPATLTESSVAPFKVSDGTSAILMDSNQIESVGGTLSLNSRGGGNDISLVAGGGDVGIGTGTPNARLEVVVAPTQSFQFRQDGFVPGINVISEGANAGIMRLRNAVEIWPSDNAARAGKLDVRNTSGNATITLNGATGNATYNNQPAIKTVESTIGTSPEISNNSLTLIEEASVTIPGDGFLHITAQAPVYFNAPASSFSSAFLELNETTGAEVLIDEAWIGFQGNLTPGSTGTISVVSISHTIPVTAGVRRFKVRIRHSGSGYALIYDGFGASPLIRTGITLMYFPRGL